MIRGAGAMTMSSESLQIPIEELLLQRGDMLLIDCLHDFGPDSRRGWGHGDSASSFD